MQVTSVANGLARGSRQYMRNRRNEIFGLFSRYGTAKFFIIINPDDVRHPLALVMGLEKPEREREVVLSIDRETFYSYRQERLKIIAEDPFSSPTSSNEISCHMECRLHRCSNNCED